MIQVTTTYSCRACGSINIVRNGTNKCGNQQYHCKDCGAYRVLEPKRIHPKRERETILRAYDDVLELDELWAFVLKKDQKRWLWTAICRRTRQIVAFVIGDRSEKTCRRLWNKIPEEYKGCQTFSDFWEAYLKVFSKETHRRVGKKSGETAHMERWYNTLRQRLARFVRKTLSFSKSDAYHHMVTKWFITPPSRWYGRGSPARGQYVQLSRLPTGIPPG